MKSSVPIYISRINAFYLASEHYYQDFDELVNNYGPIDDYDDFDDYDDDIKHIKTNKGIFAYINIILETANIPYSARQQSDYLCYLNCKEIACAGLLLQRLISVNDYALTIWQIESARASHCFTEVDHVLGMNKARKLLMSHDERMTYHTLHQIRLMARSRASTTLNAYDLSIPYETLMYIVLNNAFQFLYDTEQDIDGAEFNSEFRYIANCIVKYFGRNGEYLTRTNKYS